MDKIEVLTFVDGGVSLDWMKQAGAISQNLLTKGSLNHLTHQLKKTPEQHFSEIAEIFKTANSKGIINNIYLEDWSNGMRNSKEYVFEFLEFLATQPIKRVLLPDTLGVLTYNETYDFISEIVEKYKSEKFELLTKRAIIAANNNTSPLAASSLKNHLKGRDI